MNLLIETQTLLEKNGYVAQVVNSEFQLLTFEDESVIGFVYALDRVSQIVETWEVLHDHCLSKYANMMRADPIKSWNAYTIYLTCDDAVSSISYKLSLIEEDLRGTRKIVGTGITTLTALAQALLPILPIQKRVNLGEKESISSLKDKLEIPSILTSKSDKDIYTELESEGEV